MRNLLVGTSWPQFDLMFAIPRCLFAWKACLVLEVFESCKFGTDNPQIIQFQVQVFLLGAQEKGKPVEQL